MATRDGYIYMNAKGEFAVITHPETLTTKPRVSVRFVNDINCATVVRMSLKGINDEIKDCVRLPVVETRAVEILTNEVWDD